MKLPIRRLYYIFIDQRPDSNTAEKLLLFFTAKEIKLKTMKIEFVQIVPIATGSASLLVSSSFYWQMDFIAF